MCAEEGEARRPPGRSSGGGGDLPGHFPKQCLPNLMCPQHGMGPQPVLARNGWLRDKNAMHREILNKFGARSAS
eukprot:2321855-Pyramimonas_sp.AAC.2